MNEPDSRKGIDWVLVTLLLGSAAVTICTCYGGYRLLF
jgi:hypothetical protein